MVSRKDIAQLAGVSTMTVTRVVTGKGYVSEKTRQRVQKYVDEMNYIPNKTAANLVGRVSNVIAVILPDLTNPYYMQLVESMISEAQANGRVITVFRANSDNINNVLNDIISNRVAGVVNMALFEIPRKYVNQMRDMGMRLIHGGYDDDEFILRMDYDAAMYRAFELLKADGRKKVAFIAGVNEKVIAGDARIRCFRDYCEKFGYGLDNSPILDGNYPSEEIYTVGYSLAGELLDKQPDVDAIFCLNDMMAFGVLSCLKSRKVRVPEDIAIVGFDNLRISEFFDPPLTSIAAECDAEAKAYVDYISGCGSGGEHALHCRLYLRNSMKGQ